MEYWIVFIDFYGDVPYGVDNGTYLVGVYTTEEEAKKASESERANNARKEIEEESWFGGSTEIKIYKWNPDSDIADFFVGGGGYCE